MNYYYFYKDDFQGNFRVFPLTSIEKLAAALCPPPPCLAAILATSTLPFDLRDILSLFPFLHQIIPIPLAFVAKIWPISETKIGELTDKHFFFSNITCSALDAIDSMFFSLKAIICDPFLKYSFLLKYRIHL